MQRLSAIKKRLVIITGILAVLSLTAAFFAETAGGVAGLQHAKNTSAGNIHGSYKASGATAGADAVNTGSRASIAAAAYVQPSPATTMSSTSETTAGSASSGQPTTTPDSDSNGNSDDHQKPDSTPTPTPAPAPQPTCPQCPIPKFPGETMIACPDYCIDPDPNPGCQPCGYREVKTDAIMCPMMACMY